MLRDYNLVVLPSLCGIDLEQLQRHRVFAVVSVWQLNQTMHKMALKLKRELQWLPYQKWQLPSYSTHTSCL